MNTPAEALAAWQRSGMDALVMAIIWWKGDCKRMNWLNTLTARMSTAGDLWAFFWPV